MQNYVENQFIFNSMIQTHKLVYITRIQRSISREQDYTTTVYKTLCTSEATLTVQAILEYLQQMKTKLI